MGKPKFRKTARYNGTRYEAYGQTELEALTKLAEKLAAAQRGELLVSGSMTVSAWYKEWKANYKDPQGLTGKSLGMYDEKWKKYIAPSIGNMKLQDVRDVHLQRILNSQAGMSLSHVEKIRRVLKEMFRRAWKSRLIPFDPSEDLVLPKATTHQRRALTDQEQELLKKVCLANLDYFGLWFLTLLYTGMRPGEAAALNWVDVDFENNEIHIHSALESGTRNIKAPKTAAGVRDIPIHADLLPLLREAQGAPFSPVFLTAHKNRVNHGTWDRFWRACKRAMEIELGAKMERNKIVESRLAPGLMPYCLRHTFATNCVRAGIPLEIVRWYLGHEDISTTANVYQHPDLKALHDYMAIMDGTKPKEEEEKEQTSSKAAGGTTGGTGIHVIR